MIEIVFVVCLVTAPDQCEERVLPPLMEMSELQCLMGAQARLAAWSMNRPAFRIASWRCRRLGEGGTEA